MNRSCSYLWVVVLIPAGKTKNLFDKFQTGCLWCWIKSSFVDLDGWENGGVGLVGVSF
jgi:hypothetical protein